MRTTTMPIEIARSNQAALQPTGAPPQQRSPVLRQRLWVLCGMVCLGTGMVGIVVPLLPTTDFVLMAAYCFSRGSRRWEQWLLAHPQLGPMVLDWRTTRAIPLRAKQLATAAMLCSSTWAAMVLPTRTGWIPAAVCLAAGIYIWSRPTRAATLLAVDAQPHRPGAPREARGPHTGLR
jgi:uncharacterized membrane protein YbaN (DUF454 family)